MIPLRDVVPCRTSPAVTVALIAANVLVFAWQQATARLEPAATEFLYAWGLVPAAFSWRAAVTSLFVHSGIAHAAGNLLALWLFGGTVEDRLGHLRFAAFYLLTGLAPAVVSTLSASPASVPVVGASGAVAGVIGAYLALFPRSRVLALVPRVTPAWDVIELPAALIAVVWIGLQLAGGLGHPFGPPDGLLGWAPGVGLAAGALLVWVFRRRDRLRVEWWGV